jgi:DNA-directed RNA polymerase subunit N
MINVIIFIHECDNSMIPVRCFGCGKVIANKWLSYKKMVISGRSEAAALDEVGLIRSCCRVMFITHVETFPTNNLIQNEQVPVRTFSTSTLNGEVDK